MAESASPPPPSSSDDSRWGPGFDPMGFFRKRRVSYFLGLLGLSYVGIQANIEKKEMEATASRVMARFKERKERVGLVCESYRVNGTNPEYSSLFEGTDVNQCTNTFFTVNSRQFSICNVLKGGSLSWKEFFRYYDIPSKFLADCLKLGTCPKHVRSHLMQVFSCQLLSYLERYVILLIVFFLRGATSSTAEGGDFLSASLSTTQSWPRTSRPPTRTSAGQSSSESWCSKPRQSSQTSRATTVPECGSGGKNCPVATKRLKLFQAPLGSLLVHLRGLPATPGTGLSAEDRDHGGRYCDAVRAGVPDDRGRLPFPKGQDARDKKQSRRSEPR